MTQRIGYILLAVLLTLSAHVSIAADVLWSSVKASAIEGEGGSLTYTVGASDVLVIDENLNNIKLTINGDAKITNSDWDGTQFLNGTEVSITGNLSITSTGTLKLYGSRIDVGVKNYDEDGLITYLTEGDIINSGTITLSEGNITLSDLTNTGLVSFADGSILYSWGNITMNNGIRSEFQFASSGSQNYICTKGNFTQGIKGNKINMPKITPVYSGGTTKGTIIVAGTYYDNTDAKYRPWKFVNGGPGASTPLNTNPDMDLYAHLYEFGWADKTKGIDDAGAQFDKARVSLKSNGFNASEVPDKQLLTSILLPIELIDFAVEQVGEELNITWATAAEVNNDFFTLEYSFDGVQFEPLEIVSGAGTSSTCHEYGVWVLAEQFSGVTYFRLKQTDFDGSESYSNVVVYNVMAQNELFAVYPNPAVTEIHVSGNYELVQCVDVRNCKVALPKIEENVYSVVHLSAGNYVLILQTLHGKKAVQFVKR